jgi:peptidoglycan/LPS O-acetylase OafA/YrhL
MLDRLTWTRFVAALMVVSFHMGTHVWWVSGAWWSPLIGSGREAVCYFFVLSGFVMATIYGGIGPADAPRYWLARFARIYPLHLMMTLTFVLLFHLWAADDFVLQFGLLQAWAPGHALHWNGVAWSLSVEAFFYALFPFVMPLMRRIGIARAAAIALTLWILTNVIVLALGMNWRPISGTPESDFLKFFPLFHLDSFLIGVVAAMTAPSLSRWKRHAPLVALGAAVAIAAALLVRDSISPPLGEMSLYQLGLLSPLFALLIVGLYHAELPVLSVKIGVLLGEASFALYLVHVFVRTLLEDAILPEGTDPALTFLLGVAIALAIALVLHIFFEQPVRAMITGAAASRRPALAAASGSGRA